MTITETTTIAEIVSALPASVRVFERHGIDFCCGGKQPIGDACREHGLSFDEIASAIEASRDAVRGRDARTRPPREQRALSTGPRYAGGTRQRVMTR